jgi:hypothetical protein
MRKTFYLCSWTGERFQAFKKGAMMSIIVSKLVVVIDKEVGDIGTWET